VKLTFLVIVVSLALASSVAAQQPSGVRGVTMVGPTQPVCVESDPCEAGRSVTMNVIDLSGNVVKTFTSKKHGRFGIRLSPGTYFLKSVSVYPRGSTQVIVEEGKFTYVVVHLDSGMR